MEYDLLAALVTALRATMAAEPSGPAHDLAGRIYHIDETPHDPVRPYGQVGVAMDALDLWSEGRTYRQRQVPVAVTWTSDNLTSPQHVHDLYTLDALADTCLRSQPDVANLQWITRWKSLVPVPEEIANVEVTTLGGLWMAHMDYQY